MILQSKKISSKWNLFFDFALISAGLCFIFLMIMKCHFYTQLDGDVAPQTYALYQFVGKSLHNGQLPIWSPFLYGGMSNLGSLITQAWYPINWVLSYIFFDASSQTVGFEIIVFSLITHLFLYFIGFYLLLKKLGLDKLFSLILPVLSICSFSQSCFYQWISYLSAFSYLPLIIFTTLKVIETENKKTYLFCIALGIEFALIATIGVGVTIVYEAIIFIIFVCSFSYHVDGKILTKTNFIKIFLAGSIGILLSLPVLLSNVDFIKTSLRFVPDIGFIDTASKTDFYGFVRHKALNFDVLFQLFSSHDFYSNNGIITVLMIVGIFAKDSSDSLLKKISIIMLLFSLFMGFSIFINDFVFYIPLLNKNRESFMFGIYYNAFATILAGYGLKFLFENNIDFRRQRGLILATASLLIYNILPHRNSDKYLLIACALLFAFLFFCISHKRNEVLAKFFLIFASVITVGKFVKSIDASAFSGRGAIKQVKSVNETNAKVFSELGVLPEEKTMVMGNACYPSNQGLVQGIRESYNYHNPIYKISIDAHLKLAYDKRAKLQNIKYFLLDESNSKDLFSWFETAYPSMKNTEQKLKFVSSWSSQNKSSVKVYEAETLGPGWFVSDYKLYTDENKVIDWINSPEAMLEKTVFLNQNRLSKKSLEFLEHINAFATQTSATIRFFSNNEILYETYNDENAIFVTSETFDTGWKCFVDGKQIQVLQCDYFNRGVLLEKGKHEVRFVYRPMAFVVGIVGQIVCMMGILIYAFFLLVSSIKENHIFVFSECRNLITLAFSACLLGIVICCYFYLFF